MSQFHLAYRPKNFDEVIGQDPVIKSLRDMVKRGSAKSYILTGPSGTGKTTLARIMAKELGCSEENLLEIDAATHTGIDHWRDVTANLRYAPLGGGVKVVIVDEAHMLSKPAWNSLLKDVEEPPKHVYWFFCTTEEGRIPRTIQTRCSAYALQPVSVDNLHDLIEKVCEAEGAGPDDDILGLIARSASGSPREALTMLGTCWAAKSVKEAQKLLKAAEDQGEVYDLCRLMLKGTTWKKVVPLLATLNDSVDGESARRTVVAYFTKVLLGTKADPTAMQLADLLSCFTTPYPANSGFAPFIMSVAEYVLAGNDEE